MQKITKFLVLSCLVVEIFSLQHVVFSQQEDAKRNAVFTLLQSNLDIQQEDEKTIVGAKLANLNTQHLDLIKNTDMMLAHKGSSGFTPDNKKKIKNIIKTLSQKQLESAIEQMYTEVQSSSGPLTFDRTLNILQHIQASI